MPNTQDLLRNSLEETPIVFYNASQGVLLYNEENIKKQSLTLRELLEEKGADLQKLLGDYYSMDIWTLHANKDLFAQYIKPQALLDLAFSSYKKGHVDDAQEVKLTSEIIRFAISKGAKINAEEHMLTVAKLYSINNIFTNTHDSKHSPEDLLILTSKIDTGSEEDKTLTRELLKICFAKGININDVIEGNLSTSIAFLKEYQDVLFSQRNPLTPDNFLILISKAMLSIARGSSSENHDIIQDRANDVLELLKIAIDKGANPNVEYSHHILKGTTPLDTASNRQIISYTKEIIGFLKKQGAHCSKLSEMSYLLYKHSGIFGIGLEEATKSFIASMDFQQQEDKIPTLYHQIWLTHPNSPREVRDENIEVIIRNNKILNSPTKKWEHYLWTNDKSLIPNTVAKLAEHGIETKEISSIENQINLVDIIYQFIDKKLWGTASDILRYSITEEFGGLYTDVNFELHDNQYHLSVNDYLGYDFVSENLINNFFAAKPHHPILENLGYEIGKSFLCPPEHFSNTNSTDILTQTMFQTLLPFGISIIKFSNIGSNNDILTDANNHEEHHGWINKDQICFSPIDLLDFPTVIGVCSAKMSVFGIDGASNERLTWLED